MAIKTNNSFGGKSKRLKSPNVEVLEIDDTASSYDLIFTCKLFGKIIVPVTVSVGLDTIFCAPQLHCTFPKHGLAISSQMRGRIEKEIVSLCRLYARRKLRALQKELMLEGLRLEEEFIQRNTKGGITEVF